MAELRVQTVIESTGEPIDLEDAKTHLRIGIGQTADDDYITGLIKAIRRMVEDITNRRMMRQTLKLYIDNWPGGDSITLPYPPFSTEVAPVLEYKDTDSSTITVSSTVYRADSISEPGRIVLDYNENWPTRTLHNLNPISIQYVAGYKGSTGVPVNFKHAMKIMISDYYENRESIVVGQTVAPIPNTVLNLLQEWRVFKF
jgi:uncharacterized phiE125 gp8 family phage protein